MKKRIMLACDLDGTLIKFNNNKEIRTVLEEDKKAIEKLIDLNHIYVVATGRSRTGTEKLFEQEKMNLKEAYFITSNGAEIYNQDGEVLFKKLIDKKIVEAMIDLYEEYKNEYLAMTLFDGVEELHFDDVEKLRSFNNKDKILIACYYSNRKSVEDIRLLFQAAKEKFGNDATVVQNMEYIDMSAYQTSKADGLRFLLNEKFKGNDISLYAIGDSWNDLMMFELADKSYTLSHALDEIKAKADKVVDHVYQCINDIFEDNQ